MIDHARLAVLRDRFAALRSDYARSGEEVRTFALQLSRERADLVEAITSLVTADRVRRNRDHAALEPEKFQRDPLVADYVAGMTDDELLAAGVPLAQVTAVQAREIVLARKRKAHEQLGARVRVWAAYSDGVERLAAEYQA